MTDTVKKFIQLMLTHVKSSYEKDTNWVARWWRRNDPTQIYLSPCLFSRLLQEEKIPGTPDNINLEGVIVKNQMHPGTNTDFTIDVHGHCPEGYNSSHYGLKN